MNKEVTLRYHQADMLNNIALLSDSEMGELVISELRRQTPLRDAGIVAMQELAAFYDHWDTITVHFVEGPGDWCQGCSGLDTHVNECVYRYPFDNPDLSPEQNRSQADRTTLERHPGLRGAKTLKDVLDIVHDH